MGMSDYYKKLREKVGNDLIMISSVAGIIYNEGGDILLQNKGDKERWSLPAGAIELGESPAQAVIREVHEETGLIVIAKKLLGVCGGEDFRYVYPNGHKVEYNISVFGCEIISGDLNPTDSETVELRYFNPKKMPELAIPYPKSLFLRNESKDVYFQWNDDWLVSLSETKPVHVIE